MQKTIFRILSLLLSAVLAVMGLVNRVGSAGSPYAAEDKDGVLLNVAVAGDLHTNRTTTHGNNVKLLKLFSGISKSETPLDTFVMPGDLTETAQFLEYANLSAMLQRYVRTQTFLPATGNHDIRGDMNVEEYDKNLRNYYTFCGALGVQTDKPYWSEDVGGYTFLILGSEAEVKDSAYISPAQLQWIDDALTAAEQAGKPVFLICHQPLAHTNNVDVSWPGAGTIGDQSADVEAILQKHTEAGLPVVYISGHLHEEFSAYSFESPHENLYCLNLPSAQYNDGGKGVMLEVYADRVLIRARDFISGEWLPDAYTVPLG